MKCSQKSQKEMINKQMQGQTSYRTTQQTTDNRNTQQNMMSSWHRKHKTVNSKRTLRKIMKKLQPRCWLLSLLLLRLLISHLCVTKRSYLIPGGPFLGADADGLPRDVYAGFCKEFSSAEGSDLKVQNQKWQEEEWKKYWPRTKAGPPHVINI